MRVLHRLSSARSWPLAAALALAAACGRARGGEGQHTSSAEEPAGNEPDPAAGRALGSPDLDPAKPAGTASEVPLGPEVAEPVFGPPEVKTSSGPYFDNRRNFSCSSAAPYWARDLATGACRRVSALCEVPDGWAAFETQELCETDCRCQAITALQLEFQQLPIAHQSLACTCAREDCALTLEEEVSRRCSDGGAANVTLARGCGKVEIADQDSYLEQAAIFDEASGRLIGRTREHDPREPPCLAVKTLSGTEFACPEAQRCQLCGYGIVPHCN